MPSRRKKNLAVPFSLLTPDKKADALFNAVERLSRRLQVAELNLNVVTGAAAYSGAVVELLKRRDPDLAEELKAEAHRQLDDLLEGNVGTEAYGVISSVTAAMDRAKAVTRG